MLCSKDFYKKPKYNFNTQEQLWCSTISDFHDSFCGCDSPFAHLFTCLFPPGHTDRKLTIDAILKRDYREQCLSGGNAEESHGMATDLNIKEEDTTEKDGDAQDTEENIDMLLAAAADAAEGIR